MATVDIFESVDQPFILEYRRAAGTTTQWLQLTVPGIEGGRSTEVVWFLPNTFVPSPEALGLLTTCAKLWKHELAAHLERGNSK